MATTANTDTRQVFRLVYRSHDLIDPGRRRVELGQLFSGARSHNKTLGVTGALLVAGERFVQVLEGDETTVRDLFDRIATDPRHDHVELVETVTLTDRVFTRWAMAEVGLGGADDVPLIAHTDGIAPAAGHRATPAQTAVLATMRSAAAGSPAGQV